MSGQRDPYGSFRFHVEIQGITEASFTECGGLEAQLDVFDWEEGGMNSYIHRLPGRVKSAPNLTLKRGVATADLWGWFKSCANGQIARHNLSIILYDTDGTESMRWNVLDALPVKWSGPALRASTSEVAVETLELVHHGLERA